jgi:hypothetical protein
MVRNRYSDRLDQAMDPKMVFCTSRETSSDSVAQPLFACATSSEDAVGGGRIPSFTRSNISSTLQS